MKKLFGIVISMVMFLALSGNAFSYDLVLVHGLTNKHHWSDSFLDACLSTYGSGNVYAVYLNDSNRVWTRTINGRTLYCIGENNFSAGDDSIAVQASLMRTKTQIFQQSFGLSTKFNIIAHSMGGLVSRRYIYNNPYTVHIICTLGTPHQGSPLAYVGDFIIDYFLGAEAAMDNLKPSWVKGVFNVSYPAPGPLADSGRMYALGGDGDGYDCWGWGGELFAGWSTLSTIYWRDSDGLVARDDDKINGATYITRFWDYDHMELVTQRSVANTALQYVRP